MKERILLFLTILVVILMTGLISAGNIESSSILTTVHPVEVSISVPDEILLPDVAPGYKSKDLSFDVVNIGTRDISISVGLDNSYGEDIYQNLFFKEDSIDSPSDINTFEFNLLKPTEIGGTRTEKIFVFLDLTDYDYNLIGEKLVNHTAQIIFTAVPI